MSKTERDDPAAGLVDMLRLVVDKPRVVVAEAVDPELFYGRQTKDAVAPTDEWLLVLGASVEGPYEFVGIQLVVGEFEVGVLRPNLLYAIPPRQCYRLSLPFTRPLPAHLANKDLSFLPGRFRLFGWRLQADWHAKKRGPD